jgi:hypothetical protein
MPIICLGLFLTQSLDLFGDLLNSVIPNMKKKKDEAFDKLKANLIKQIKDSIKQLSELFGEIT